MQTAVPAPYDFLYDIIPVPLLPVSKHVATCHTTGCDIAFLVAFLIMIIHMYHLQANSLEDSHESVTDSSSTGSRNSSSDSSSSGESVSVTISIEPTECNGR